MIDWSLMYVTDQRLTDDRQFFEVLEGALRGGVTTVQLREKNLDDQQCLNRARHTLALCRQYQVPLLINDRVELARTIGADGVHLGQSDMSVQQAREQLGPTALIGLSVSNRQQAQQARSLAIDYFGVSPVFATPTKTDTDPAVGLNGLADLCQQLPHLPAIAIGGVSTANAAALFKHGARGLAVITAISQANHPEHATRELRSLCPTGLN